jgi:hypothetical protein
MSAAGEIPGVAHQDGLQFRSGESSRPPFASYPAAVVSEAFLHTTKRIYSNCAFDQMSVV